MNPVDAMVLGMVVVAVLLVGIFIAPIIAVLLAFTGAIL